MSQESKGSKSLTATSPANIAQGSPPDVPIVLQSRDSVQPIEKAAAALEEQLGQLRAERKVERFFWILTVSGILNAFLDSFIPWGAAATLLLFSLILLIGAARWLEVPWVVRHLERWFDRASMTRASNETE